jgi:hypothetical protein
MVAEIYPPLSSECERLVQCLKFLMVGLLQPNCTGLYCAGTEGYTIVVYDGRRLVNWPLSHFIALNPIPCNDG